MARFTACGARALGAGRVFRTLQGRLPKELALAGIRTVADSSRFLRERFIPAYNARFAVKAHQPGAAFVPIAPQQSGQLTCYLRRTI